MDHQFTRSALRCFVWLGCFLLFALSSASLHAAQVTFEVYATVAEVNDHAQLLSGAIAPGDTIACTFGYDLSGTNSSKLSSVGAYDFTSGPGVVAKVNGLTFQSDPSNLKIHVELIKSANDTDGDVFDSFVLRSYTNLNLNSSVTVDCISWQLDDLTATALLSSGLPQSALNLTKWESLYGLTFEGKSTSNPAQTYLIRAHVYEITPVANGTLP